MATRNKLKRIQELTKQINELKKEQSELKEQVTVEMGRKKSLIVGKFMAVWKERVKGFQSKDFKEENPDLYQAYYSTEKTKYLSIVNV